MTHPPGMRSVLAATLLFLLAGCPDRQARPAGEPSPAEQLLRIPGLPDPFRLAGGGRVERPAQWQERRREIARTLLKHQYGHPPAAVGRLASRRIAPRLWRLSFGPGQRLYLYVGIDRPAGPGPFPTIVHIDHRGPFAVSAATVQHIIGQGYALAAFDPGVLDPDRPGTVGPAQAAYPDHDWATLAVWAWGASRVADHLLGQPWVDGRRLIVTGHSRSGKAALLAGALDRRFALTVPQGSGCGGAATYRFRGPGAENLARLTRSFPHWLVPDLSRFGGQEQRLPFDQHFVLALVAPRALLTIDALGDRWASPPATQIAHMGAGPVYGLLGAPNRLGLHFRPGAHELADTDWRTLLHFADRVLSGRDPGPGYRATPLSVPTPFSWSAP